MSGFHFGVMYLNLNVIVKGYQNMNKLYDNGLTDEQQKLVDERYEAMLSIIKKINPMAYEMLRKSEPLEGKILYADKFGRTPNVKKYIQNQLDMFDEKEKEKI